jgi:hypothetical protein
VPGAIRQEIAGWELPRKMLLEVLNSLHQDLADNPYERCFQVPAPVPTFVFQKVISDDNNPGYQHFFIFNLTHGREDQTMVIIDCAKSYGEIRPDD